MLYRTTHKCFLLTATGEFSPVAVLLLHFTRHLRDNLPMLFIQHCAVQKLLHKIPTFHFLDFLQHFDELCEYYQRTMLWTIFLRPIVIYSSQRTAALRSAMCTMRTAPESPQSMAMQLARNAARAARTCKVTLRQMMFARCGIAPATLAARCLP